MIIDVNGKRIAFGMQWKSRLSEGDVHADARAAKSRYFWHADKAFYLGVLSESDAKEKLKAPLYSGAIALQHRYPDVPNLMLVLEIPAGGFIVCGIHQGRPRNGSDTVVQTQVEVSELLKEFKVLCGHQSFKLYGDVPISGIEAASMEDVLRGADQAAVLRKTKSALVDPLALIAVGVVVVGAGSYGWHSYSQYKAAEAARLAMAAQKNSQQLYVEELAVRGRDATILAKNVQSALAPLRAMSFTLGGWNLAKATCNIPSEMQMVCTFEYTRAAQSKATYETFVAAAKGFDNVDFTSQGVKAMRTFKELPFIPQSKAIEAAKAQRDEIVEFGSDLQRIEHLGKPMKEEFQPFAVPPGANLDELTTPPVAAAKWTFDGPFRNLKHFESFPAYATVSQLVVTYTDKPVYEAAKSMVTVSVTGKIFSKPQT